MSNTAQYVVLNKSFINGALKYPGETVTLTLQPATDDREADTVGKNLAKKGSKEARPFERAAADPVPIAAIGPTGPHPTVPQGLPPGSIQASNGTWLTPGSEPGTYVEVVPGTPQTDKGLADTVQAEADQLAARSTGTGAIDGSEKDSYEAMTKAELKDAITAAGGTFESDANKAALIEALKKARSS